MNKLGSVNMGSTSHECDLVLVFFTPHSGVEGANFPRVERVPLLERVQGEEEPHHPCFEKQLAI